MMKIPLEMAKTFPKFDRVVGITVEEIAKVRQNSSWLNLEGIDRGVKNSFILEILLMHVVWLIPHLMVNSSASVLVMLIAWWIVLMSGLSWVCMWAINIATLFLVLIWDAMIATDKDEKNSKTISLSNWVHNLSSFFY